MGSSGGPTLEALSVQAGAGDSAAKGAHPRRGHSVNELGEIPNAPGRTLLVDSATFAEYEKREAKRWVAARRGRRRRRPPALRGRACSGLWMPQASALNFCKGAVGLTSRRGWVPPLASPPRRRHLSICCLPILSPVGRRANFWGGVAAMTDVICECLRWLPPAGVGYSVALLARPAHRVPPPPAAAADTGFIVPISIGWGTTAWDWITICGLLGSLIYLLDIIINFHTGFIVRWDLHTLVVQGERLGRESRGGRRKVGVEVMKTAPGGGQALWLLTPRCHSCVTLPQTAARRRGFTSGRGPSGSTSSPLSPSYQT